MLDYVAVASTATNLTFQGDSTYYISGGVSLSGTTVIEDGAVLKICQSHVGSRNHLGTAR